MDILYKTITADTIVSNKPCWLLGVELSHSTANTSLKIYNEPNSTASAAKLVCAAKVRYGFRHWDKRMFDEPGIKCNGIFADYDAGIGTVYYHY